MTKWLIGTALSLMIVSPATAQLLGSAGGGMLGGSLGGSLGRAGSSSAGGLLGGTLGRTAGGANGNASSAGSVRTQRSVDTRSGKAGASGSASGGSALDGATSVADRSAGGSAAVSGSASGSADAQLIGSDALASTVRDGAAMARGLAGQGRDAATGAGEAAVSTARGVVSQSVVGVAGAGGSIGPNQLALAGTAAASGAGTFEVTRGMDVTDMRGKVLGTVQEVRTTASGVVQAVTVAVGDHIATLPATTFNGSGEVLVSQMGRAELKRAAGDQQAQ